MAQIIKHRRGSIDGISAATARKGELVLATGSIGALQSPVLFIGNDDSAGPFSPVSKIYQGTTAPVLGGSFGSTMNGTPFYSSDSQSLYILSNSGNNRLDLSGNLEGNDISNLTITSLTGSNGVFDTFVSASALNVTGNTQMIGTLGVNGATTINNNLTVTGNTNVSGTTTVNGATLINNNLTVTGSTNVTGTTNLGGSVNITGATLINNNLTVTGNTNVSGTTTVNGATLINNNLTVTGNTNVNGNVNITGTTSISGLTTIDDTLNVNSNLNVTGNTILNGNVTVTGLTNNRLVVVGTGGLLEDDANLTFDGTSLDIGQGQFQVDVASGNIRTSGSIVMKGDITIGDQNTDNIILAGEVSSSIVPDINNTFDLGSTSKYWRDLYVSGTAYVGTLNANTISLSGITVFDDLVVSGSAYLGQGGGDKVIVSGSLYNDALTNNRIVIVGTNGLLEDDANFTFDGTTFKIGDGDVEMDVADGDIRTSGSLNVKGAATIDNNLTVTGNTNVSGTTTVNGATLINNNLTVTGNTNVTGTTNLGGNVNITGATLINNNLTVTGNTNITGSTNVGGNVNITGTTSISGKTTVDDDLDVIGNVNITGNTNVTGTTTVNGATLINNNLTVTGSTSVTATTNLGGNVNITGATLINNNLTVTGNTNVNGNVSITGTTSISGKTTVDDDLDVTGNLKVTGTTTVDGVTLINNNLTVTGNTNVSGTTTVNGATLINNNLTVTGNTNVSGATTINGATLINNNLTVTGNTQIDGNLTISGSFSVLGSVTEVHISSSVIELDDNIIRLNTYSPFERYAGFEVIDSGSNGISASFVWDSLNDYWMFVSSSAQFSKLIGTTAGTYGSEVSLTTNTIPKATGANTIGDSLLTENATTLAYNTNKFTVASTDGATLIAGNVTLSAGGGSDSNTKSSAILFRNSSNVIGFVSTTETTDVLDGILGYKNSNGGLVFSSLIDGGTY